jgi:hypothetical protein
VPNRQVNRFPGLLVQFLQVGQAQTTNIELPDSRLTDGKTCNSEVMIAIRVTVQESRSHQIGQKTVNCADWQPCETSHLLCGKPTRRLAEKVKKAQSSLKSGNVVIAFWAD